MKNTLDSLNIISNEIVQFDNHKCAVIEFTFYHFGKKEQYHIKNYTFGNLTYGYEFSIVANPNDFENAVKDYEDIVKSFKMN